MLPCCMDMPYKVTHSHGIEFKEYGIHNGAQCVLKGWLLDDRDVERLKDNTDDEVILKYLPKTLYVELLHSMKKNYPGLPAQWFPMKPVSTYWCLDADDNIDICRRGFSLVPNFSSTVHSATGRTLTSCIADLGDLWCIPGFQAAMRGYIALSRVRAAHHLLLSQPFSPLLFCQGTQPYPSLLLDVLRGKVVTEDVMAKSLEARNANKNLKLLKAQCWTCGECGEHVPTCNYVKGSGQEWQAEVFEKIIRTGRLRRCLKCTTQCECSVCAKVLPPTSFSASRMQHHNWPSHGRRLVCVDCSNPACTSAACSTCRVCRDPACTRQQCDQPIKPLHWQVLPTSLEDVKIFLCRSCRFPCALCTVPKGERDFPKSMWHHLTRDRRVLCFDCCRPRCTSSECETCTLIPTILVLCFFVGVQASPLSHHNFSNMGIVVILIAGNRLPSFLQTLIAEIPTYMFA